MKIPGRQDPKVNIFKLVSNWLQDDTTGRWILIVDNIDDDCLHEPPPVTMQDTEKDHITGLKQPILTFLPRVPHGSIIFTTRRAGVALKLVDERDVIVIDPMEKPHALELMQKKLGIETDNGCTMRLLESLEFMPLAIIQAAAYIRHRAPRCSVPQYLKEFQESDRKRMRLLGYEAGHPHRDSEAKNSIIITWQLSFAHIQKIRNSAADLLSLMSFFDRQGVSEKLLRPSTQSADSRTGGSDSLEDVTHDDQGSEAEYEALQSFEDDIAMLREFSFISVGDNGSVFEMHGLVQLATRNWLKSTGAMEKWKRRFIDILSTEFPSVEYENWRTCQRLFPHVRSAALQRPESRTDLRVHFSTKGQGMHGEEATQQI